MLPSIARGGILTCCRQAAGTALSSNSSPARIGSRRSGWQDFTTAVPRPTRQLSTTATRVGGDVIPQERQRRSTQQARQDARVNSTSSSPSSSTSTSSPPPRLPYGVTRTLRNHALPVYSSIRNAGLRNEVLIRHCVGNLNALKSDLEESFGTPRQGVRITVEVNRKTSAIVITGRDKPSVMEVKSWLAERGH